MIYYISSNGSDSNNGTSTNTPWQTLSKVNSTTFVAGDQILFNKGDTFYGTFTINQSGNSSNQIIIGAYGTGNNPIITGFTNISAWTNLGSNIWESTNAVSTLSNCNMVTINNVNTEMGRFPKSNATNSGYLTLQTHSGQVSITSSDLTGTPNWVGAEVVIRTSNYKIDRSVITSQDVSTLNFTTILNEPTDGNGFFLQASLLCCTQQNDWYYNPTTKKISIYSTSQPSNVNVASIEKIITLNGSYITITNITFSGANGHAIFNGSNNHITITNCTFNYMGVGSFYGDSSYVDIENCTFLESNGGSIASGYGVTDYTIKNNSFTNIGILKGMKDLRTYSLINSVIELAQLTNLDVEYNTFTNIGYIGVWFYGWNILVKRNFFTNWCNILNDGGAIYTYTGGRTAMTNVLLTENICVNTSLNANDGCVYKLASPGIYLDYASANVEISYNSIANTLGHGIYMSSGGNVYTHHNTVFNASEHQLFIKIDDVAHTLSTTDKVLNNIFVAKLKLSESDWQGNPYKVQKCLNYNTYTDTDMTQENKVKAAANNLDYNIYARPIDNTSSNKVILASLATYAGSFLTLAEWKAWSGQDSHSTEASQTISSVDDFQFEYNNTTSDRVVALNTPMIDMSGTKYYSNIVIHPYSSAILMIDKNPTIPQTEIILKYITYNAMKVTYNGNKVTTMN